MWFFNKSGYQQNTWIGKNRVHLKSLYSNKSRTRLPYPHTLTEIKMSQLIPQSFLFRSKIIDNLQSDNILVVFEVLVPFRLQNTFKAAGQNNLMIKLAKNINASCGLPRSIKLKSDFLLGIGKKFSQAHDGKQPDNSKEACREHANKRHDIKPSPNQISDNRFCSRLVYKCMLNLNISRFYTCLIGVLVQLLKLIDLSFFWTVAFTVVST